MVSTHGRSIYSLHFRTPGLLHTLTYLVIVTGFLVALTVPGIALVSVNPWSSPEVSSEHIGKSFLWLCYSLVVSIFTIGILWLDMERLTKQFVGRSMTLNATLVSKRLRLSPNALEKAKENPAAWAVEPLSVPKGIAIAMMFLLLAGGVVSVLAAVYTNYSYPALIGLSCLTGVVFVGTMTVSDRWAHRAYLRCICLSVDDGKQQSANAELSLRSMVELLGDYQKMFYFVDIPIMVSLLCVTGYELYHAIHNWTSNHNMDGFHVGFLAGTVAMHVIIANVVSILIVSVDHRYFEDTLSAGQPQEAVKEEGSWWRLTYILFAAVLLTIWTHLLVSTGGSHAAAQPVRVAVMTWGGAGPGFVGIEKGFFGSTQVELRIIDDSRARHAAYKAEEFEVLLTNPDQHPRELEIGLPGSMILCSDVSLGADGMIAHPSITTISDLKGKRIAYVQGSASDYMVTKALASAGLSRSDVLLQAVDDPSTSVAALYGGQISAAVSWEPLMSQAVSSGNARILFTSRDIPDTIVGVFVAKKTLTSDPHRLEDFIKGWIESVEFCKSHPEESRAIMSKAFGVNSNEMNEMMSGITLLDASHNTSWMQRTQGLSRLDQLAHDAAGFWHQEGLLKQIPPNSKSWTNSDAAAIVEKLSSK